MLEKELRKQMKKYLKARDMKPTAFAKEFGRMSIAKTTYDFLAGGTITLRTWDSIQAHMDKYPPNND